MKEKKQPNYYFINIEISIEWRSKIATKKSHHSGILYAKKLYIFDMNASIIYYSRLQSEKRKRERGRE